MDWHSSQLFIKGLFCWRHWNNIRINRKQGFRWHNVNYYQFTNNLIIKNIASCPILYSLTISIKLQHSLFSFRHHVHLPMTLKISGWWIEFGKVTKERLFISIKLSISLYGYIEWIVQNKVFGCLSIYLYSMFGVYLHSLCTHPTCIYIGH